MTRNTKVTLSIVTPCFNEEDNIRECYERTKALFTDTLHGFEREHIFVDNGSQDSTVEILRELASQDKKIRVILNSRNFGPFNSMFNGLKATTGDLVVPFLPADCQDPPEILPAMIEKWRQGFQVVFGVRASRRETQALRVSRSAYYKLVGKISNVSLPANAGEFALVEKKVVDAIRDVEDYYPYVRGLIAYAGFRSTTFTYAWGKREKGVSRNKFPSLIDQGLNGAISFSNLPMRFVMALGVAISIASLMFAGFVLGSYFLGGSSGAQAGIQATVFGVYFLSGVILFAIGVLGEYISAIHSQVRKRPMVIEAERINFD